MAANPEMREIERRKLNITEGLILSALVGLAALIFRMNDSVTRLQAGQESTNRQLAALQAQLADIPGLTRAQAELKVHVDRNSDDIHELRGKRGWE